LSFGELEELERNSILKAMEQTQYRVAQAIELLDTNKSTLYRKLKKYDINF